MVLSAPPPEVLCCDPGSYDAVPPPPVYGGGKGTEVIVPSMRRHVRRCARGRIGGTGDMDTFAHTHVVYVICTCFPYRHPLPRARAETGGGSVLVVKQVLDGFLGPVRVWLLRSRVNVTQKRHTEHFHLLRGHHGVLVGDEEEGRVSGSSSSEDGQAGRYEPGCLA